MKRRAEPEGGAAAHCYRFLIVEEVSPITVFKLLLLNMSSTVQGPGTFINAFVHFEMYRNVS